MPQFKFHAQPGEPGKNNLHCETLETHRDSFNSSALPSQALPSVRRCPKPTTGQMTLCTGGGEGGAAACGLLPQALRTVGAARERQRRRHRNPELREREAEAKHQN